MDFNHSGFETLCARETFAHEHFQYAHNLPILATSTFVYKNYQEAREYFAGKNEEHMNIYSRWANPTVMVLEDKLADLETFDLDKTAQCLYFSSGMAAISAAIMAHLKNGDCMITQGNLYGTSTELFQTVIPKQGITVHEINAFNREEVEKAFKTYAPKLIYLESPSNPTMDCVDIKSISQLAKTYNVLVIADNTFNTPYVQQPFQLGVDVVVYSATKFLNGHGNALGGAVISTDSSFIDKVWQIRKTIGHVSSPFDAWLTYNGLKTLPLRMKKHIENASAIANFLQDHQAVSRVNYLGLPNHPSHKLAKEQMHHFGSMISFELKGGKEAGIRLLQSIKELTLTASLGTTDTLITHPASTTHVQVSQQQRLDFGISDGLIRLSVGLEGSDDLIQELQRGL